jgi:hypothetical protein
MLARTWCDDECPSIRVSRI